MLLDKAGAQAASDMLWMKENAPQKRDVVAQAHQRRLAEGAVHAAQRFFAVSAKRDDLCQHGIIINRDRAAGKDACIGAHALAGWLAPEQSIASRGQEELVGSSA